MDPDKIMGGLSKELNPALKAMAKAKDVDDPLTSKICLKNTSV